MRVHALGTGQNRVRACWELSERPVPHPGRVKYPRQGYHATFYPLLLFFTELLASCWLSPSISAEAQFGYSHPAPALSGSRDSSAPYPHPPLALLPAVSLLLNFIPVVTAGLGHKAASQRCTPTPSQHLRVRVIPTGSTENIRESVTAVTPILERDLHPGVQMGFCQSGRSPAPPSNILILQNITACRKK